MRTPTCEAVINWMQVGVRPPLMCGKLAVFRYPTLNGGLAYVCLQHATVHREYAEPCYAGEEG